MSLLGGFTRELRDNRLARIAMVGGGLPLAFAGKPRNHDQRDKRPVKDHTKGSRYGQQGVGIITLRKIKSNSGADSIRILVWSSRERDFPCEP